MATALKHLYSPAYIRRLANDLHAADARFDARAFERRVLGRGWRDLELKARMRRISTTLGELLPGTYRRQLATLRRVAGGYTDFGACLFPDFVEVYGADHYDASIDALAHFTRFSSSEFAIRPFIVREPRRTMRILRSWADDPNEHVRRLASEGCRPRLPWGIALQAFKADPSPILPILEALRADPSEYVRRSVANNLNDIAKDHPDRVLEIARRWLGRSEETDRLVKHACRTLLKRGDQRALQLFGHHDDVPVKATLTVASDVVAIGSQLPFRIEVRAAADAKARIEYSIDFVTKSGGRSRKIFKVGEWKLEAGKSRSVERQHRFNDLTIRKHHAGAHRIGVVVNGVERAHRAFEVTA